MKKLALLLWLLPSLAFAQGPSGPSPIISGANPVIGCTNGHYVYNNNGVVGCQAVTVPTGANPSASVGLTAVNGSAATFMRSDGAPALDQTAAYAFSGLGATTISANAANTSALTIGNVTSTASAPVINASQTINGAVTATGIFYNMLPGATPPNATSPLIQLQYSTADVFKVARNGVITVTNSGNATTMSASFGEMTFGSSVKAALFETNGAVRFGASIGAPDTFINRGGAAATFQLGSNNAASPVAQTLQAQGSRAGTDSNVGGAGITITSGTGTGTGTRSVLTLQSPVVVASGTGAQTQTTGWRIDGGTGVSTGYTVAALPATPLAGARAHVTDQLTTCAAIGAALTGGGAVTCPAFYNGAAWVGG